MRGGDQINHSCPQKEAFMYKLTKKPMVIALILFIIIVWTICSQFGWYKKGVSRLKEKIIGKRTR